MSTAVISTCPAWCDHKHPAVPELDGTERKRTLSDNAAIAVDLVSGAFSADPKGQPKLQIFAFGNPIGQVRPDPDVLREMADALTAAAGELERIG